MLGLCGRIPRGVNHGKIVCLYVECCLISCYYFVYDEWLNLIEVKCVVHYNSFDIYYKMKFNEWIWLQSSKYECYVVLE